MNECYIWVLGVSKNLLGRQRNGHLEVAYEEVGGRESQEGGDIPIPTADSCWCVAETNTIL